MTAKPESPGKTARLPLPFPPGYIASPKSASVGPPSYFSSWLPVTLPRGYKGADDLWLYPPLTSYTPDKRKRVVRQRKGICRTRSPVA
jgi:hypothetical protein